MTEIATVGLDLAKAVVQVHGANRVGQVMLRKRLRRDQVLSFFSALPRCTVAMEACGGAHFWAREIGRLGHEVCLIPPAYVKIPSRPIPANRNHRVGMTFGDRGVALLRIVGTVRADGRDPFLRRDLRQQSR